MLLILSHFLTICSFSILESKLYETVFLFSSYLVIDSFYLPKMQVIELQLPSFFSNFDPRAAAANFPSSNNCFS